MTPRPCYPMDVPRGARLVEHDGIIADVRWRVEERRVALVLDDGRIVDDLPYDVKVEIDEDKPERQTRLTFARTILGIDS